jgi:carbonic anhydrase/acetyltransferase-like protein (isoleucine patch superfamily)
MERRRRSAFLTAYRFAVRARAKAFSKLSARGFASFGRGSLLEPPLRLAGEHRISVGDEVFLAAGSWLQVLDSEDEGVAIEIGDGTSFAGGCVLSAVRSIRLGKRVLFARNVYVADHMHAFENPEQAVLDQGITRIAPVEIGDGAWLGQNTVVGPGVSIGAGAVIGANAVVLEDVPSHSVAVGAPARVVRRFAGERQPAG